MAVTTEIPWGDGSGDKIYLTRNASEGDQVVQVSSDANSGNARSKVVTFTSGIGNIQRQLTISQAAGVVEQIFTANPFSYIPKATDGSWYSLSNPSNAYKDADTTGYAQIALTRGANAETWIYWLFDTTQLPANANIISVECEAKLYCGDTSASVIAYRQAQLYSGTTPKGSSVLIPQPAAVQTIDGGSWTRAELDDVRLRLRGIRGDTSTTTTKSFRFYGATLTIKYVI
jgi:hypothetical protein